MTITAARILAPNAAVAVVNGHFVASLRTRPTPELIAKLEAAVDPECVVFANRELETQWQRRVLGYGDAGS